MKWSYQNAVLFDASGNAKTPQGEQMLNTLAERFGGPSRAMWKAYEQATPEIKQKIEDLVEKIMNAVGKKIEVS